LKVNKNLNITTLNTRLEWFFNIYEFTKDVFFQIDIISLFVSDNLGGV